MARRHAPAREEGFPAQPTPASPETSGHAASLSSPPVDGSSPSAGFRGALAPITDARAVAAHAAARIRGRVCYPVSSGRAVMTITLAVIVMAHGDGRSWGLRKVDGPATKPPTEFVTRWPH